MHLSGFKSGTAPAEVAHHPISELAHRKEDADLHGALERVYLRNFLDAIPALKVPDTLTWTRPAHRFTNEEGGFLLLFFKVLVILPVIGVFVQFFKRPLAT